MKTQLLGMALAGVLAATPAAAHHDQVTLGTVTITQPALFGGTTLQPGTYEVRDSGDHPEPLPGQSPDGLATIEFVMNGQVVARGGAEIVGTGVRAGAAPVGTSGGADARLQVQMLRGGEFMRVSTRRGSERYLIHLAIPGQSPAPAPTRPAR